MTSDGARNTLKAPETVQVGERDSPDVAFQSRPLPSQRQLRKGSGGQPPTQAPPLDPRTLQLYRHLKYLFNNNRKKKKPTELL